MFFIINLNLRSFAAFHHKINIHSESIQDFSESVGLIEAMDLVISVGTLVTHLAGACRHYAVIIIK